MQQSMNGSVELASKPVPLTGGGQMLREAREVRGLDIEQVASDLRLTSRQVQALEAEDFSALPEPTYVCGYVRNYARYLNLASDEIIARYPNLETLRPDRQPAVETRITRSDLKKQSMDIPIPLLVSVALLVIIATWYLSGDDEVVVPETATVDTREAAPASPGQELAATGRSGTPAPGDATPAADLSELPRDGSMSKTTITNAAEAARSGDSAQMRAVEQAALTTLKKIEQVEEEVGDFSESEEAEEKARAQSESPQRVAQAGHAQQAAAKLIPASKLTIRYSLDSWTDVVDARGRKLIYKLGKAGSSATVVGVAPFKAFFGFAPGVEMSVNGKAVDMTPYQLLETANIRVGNAAGNTLAYGIRPGGSLPGRVENGTPVAASNDRNRARQEIRKSLSKEDSTRISAVDGEPKNAKPAKPAAGSSESTSRGRDKSAPAPIFDLFDQ